jgi:hypothetical protein
MIARPTPHARGNINMKKFLLLALASAGLAMFAAEAARAHDYHSSCQKGVYGWHRHAWYKGEKRRIECSPAIHHKKWHKPHCVQKCNWFGPFKQCKTHCD